MLVVCVMVMELPAICTKASVFSTRVKPKVIHHLLILFT